MRHKIHFEVQKKKTLRADHAKSVVNPSQGSSFVLVFNDDWNDYGYYTWFALWYFDAHYEKRFIGEVKILSKDDENTFNVIPKSFDEPLSSDFCSLGITSSYYMRLKAILNDTEHAYEVLSFLRDVTIDIKTKEEFENITGYQTSLLRDLSSEKAMKEAKLLLESRNPDMAYSFKYRFRVPYNKDTDCVWRVSLKYKPLKFKRIVGVIGENGVGKTSMLKQYVQDFVSNENGGFDDKPLFNSLNVVSSVSSDSYLTSMPDNIAPYNYYHLDQSRENYDKIVGAAIRIAKSHVLVDSKSKIQLYREIVSDLIGKLREDIFIVENEATNDYFPSENISLKDDSLRDLLPKLSSGQLHMLALATFLIADMHMSSLVIIDEPEIHLHPSAIVEFMTFLMSLLDMFKSFAVIATHSPLIVRELTSDNVYQFYRVEGQIPKISKVNYDTFGEDTSTLYCKIFGYDENGSIFNNIVTEYARKRGVKVENIERILSPDRTMNLNARLRIFDIVKSIRDNA